MRHGQGKIQRGTVTTRFRCRSGVSVTLQHFQSDAATPWKKLQLPARAARPENWSQHHPTPDDPFNLQRFMNAQEDDYEDVCAELRAGRKTTHWMWFIFPQMKGLGMSATSDKFAISSLDEAKAYLRHPILGERLRECARLVNLVEGPFPWRDLQVLPII